VSAYKKNIIHKGGKIALFLAGICLLFCLPVCAALGNEKTADANTSRMPAETSHNTEGAVVTTETLTTEAADAVMPAVVPEQQEEIKAVPMEAKETLSAGATEEVTPAPVQEQQAETKAVQEQTEEQQHRVHRVWLWQETRDCLWNLAKIYYNDPWQWKKIYLANQSQIEDPRKIFPKQELIIPPVDGTENK
jgi:nucleoid-associated protein YgaU